MSASLDSSSLLLKQLVTYHANAGKIVPAIAGLLKEAAARRVISPVREVVLVVSPDRIHPEVAHVVAVSVHQAITHLAVQIRVVGFAQQGLTQGGGWSGAG